MSPTQTIYLEAFIVDYLFTLKRQLLRWGTATQDFSIQTAMPLRTRDALIRKGLLEIADRYTGTTTERKGYNFGRVYRSVTVPVGRVTLAPTKIAIDWFLRSE